MAVHGLIVRALGGGTSKGTIALLIRRGLNALAAVSERGSNPLKRVAVFMHTQRRGK